MKKSLLAVLLVCVVGLVAYLVRTPVHEVGLHNADYYFNRAWKRLPGGDNDQTGDPEGAIADFNRAIKLNPEYAAAYAGRAIAKEVMADRGYRVSIFSSRERESSKKKALRDEAIADLDRAIELDPRKADYFGRRAILKHRKGDFSGMIADMAGVIEVMPSAEMSLRTRLRHEGSFGITPAGLLRGRLRHYDRAISLNPAFSWGYYHRAVLKHLAGDLEGALVDFRRCSDFPDTKLRDYAAIHIWLVRAQKSETFDANAELSAYFSTRANNASPDWEKQIAEFLLNRVSEGDLLGAASGSEAERRRSEFWYYRAMKLLLAGEKAEAVECFSEALTTEVRPYAVMISAEIQLGQLNQ